MNWHARGRVENYTWARARWYSRADCVAALGDHRVCRFRVLRFFGSEIGTDFGIVFRIRGGGTSSPRIVLR